MATKVTIDLSRLRAGMNDVCDKVGRKTASYIVQSAKQLIRSGKKSSKPHSAPKVHTEKVKRIDAKGRTVSDFKSRQWLVQHEENFDAPGSSFNMNSVGGVVTTITPKYYKTKATQDSLVTLNQGGSSKGSFIARYRKNLHNKLPRLSKKSPLFYNDES